MNSTSSDQPLTARILFEVLIRFGILFALVYLCFKVFAPFMALIIWAIIMAVALYPFHQKLAVRFGGKSGRASTIMVLGTLLLLGAPTVIVGLSTFKHVQDLYSDFHNGTLTLDPPKESVADWPVVGDKVYTQWTFAAENMPKFIEENRPALKQVSEKTLGTASRGFKSILLLLGAFITAGVMMAFAQEGTEAIRRIFSRVCGDETGTRMQELCTGTIRSVAVGVLGVAFIQALLFGIGFVLCGIPAAGIFALIVLFLGIIQIPAALVGIPVVAYLWMGGDGSAVSNGLFTLWFLVASLSDNILKPMLLGRGVDAPMPVILIGALGGMVAAGFIGLFLGAVLLAVGYKLFMSWVHTPAQKN
ncbi:MAG: AI-2E family transporter [Coraliomargarita sp.]